MFFILESLPTMEKLLRFYQERSFASFSIYVTFQILQFDKPFPLGLNWQELESIRNMVDEFNVKLQNASLALLDHNGHSYRIHKNSVLQFLLRKV